ncbi:MAG: hypothetical protein IIA45_03600 [Bacteroidetes bacterium]|nr:hypothetical protein [Bacteroidota bacterium]
MKVRINMQLIICSCLVAIILCSCNKYSIDNYPAAVVGNWLEIDMGMDVQFSFYEDGTYFVIDTYFGWYGTYAFDGDILIMEPDVGGQPWYDYNGEHTVMLLTRNKLDLLLWGRSDFRFERKD